MKNCLSNTWFHYIVMMVAWLPQKATINLQGKQFYLYSRILTYLLYTFWDIWFTNIQSPVLCTGLLRRDKWAPIRADRVTEIRVFVNRISQKLVLKANASLWRNHLIWQKLKSRFLQPHQQPIWQLNAAGSTWNPVSGIIPDFTTSMLIEDPCLIWRASYLRAADHFYDPNQVDLILHRKHAHKQFNLVGGSSTQAFK